MSVCGGKADIATASGRSIVCDHHPIPACIDTSVNFAPAELGTFNVIRYAAIRSALAPSATNWLDDLVSTVNAVGSDELGDG